MTKKHLTLFILAVLTALILAGCGIGVDSEVASSAPEGLNTFGVDVNPSAQPSIGQVLPEATPAENTDNPNISGGDTTVSGDNAPPAVTSGNSGTTVTSTPAPSSGSSSGGSSTSPRPTVSDEPVSTPSSGIVPPAPASSATIEDVMGYVGKSPRELIEDKGYPTSSSYDFVDEDDPNQGEIGTMFYPTFTVTTLRKDGTETITAVTPKASASPTVPSPSA